MSATPNPGYDKTVAILREAGYIPMRGYTARVERGETNPEERFEVWAGGLPTQTLILQKWKDGNGVAVYGNRAYGSTYDELKAML